MKTKSPSEVVKCEVGRCARPFKFVSPENLRECRVVDLEGKELGLEYAFVCPQCCTNYEESED